MWTKILAPLLAVPLGLFTSHNIEDYATSLRPSSVMSMVEEPNDLMAVPQPRPYVEVEPVREVYTTSGCSSNVCYVNRCSTRYTCNWWDRGPVRRTFKWFHNHRPVRKLLARVCCRRWRCR